MPSRYHLIRPIFGFLSEDRQVITIPAGAILQPIIAKNGLGLCTSLWEERLVMVFGDDIQRNGISRGDLGDLTR